MDGKSLKFCNFVAARKLIQKDTDRPAKGMPLTEADIELAKLLHCTISDDFL